MAMTRAFGIHFSFFKILICISLFNNSHDQIVLYFYIHLECPYLSPFSLIPTSRVITNKLSSLSIGFMKYEI